MAHQEALVVVVELILALELLLLEVELLVKVTLEALLLPTMGLEVGVVLELLV
jgi:hypothetical protein